MRKAHEDVNVIKFNDEPTPAGISLGFGRCAEHEFGITGLESLVGIEKYGRFGVEKRIMNGIPTASAAVFDDKKTMVFAVEAWLLERLHRSGDLADMDMPAETVPYIRGKLPATLAMHINFPNAMNFREPDGSVKLRAPKGKAELETLVEKSKGIQTAWDSNGFMIAVRGKEERKLLLEIVQAFENVDLTIGLGSSSNPYSRGGLNVVIASRIPQNVLDTMLKNDLEHQELIDFVEATGVKGTLKKAGLGWNSLTPRWLDENKTDVIFFLNPIFQNRFRSGWVCVGDLEAWASASGPILKSNPAPEHFGFINQDLRDRNQEYVDNHATLELTV